MIRVLHITPHMGGGIGRALSGFALQARGSDTCSHTYICLEQPEKRQGIDRMLEAGCEVTVAPSDEGLTEAIAVADVIQVEFWNHPALLRMLCDLSLPAMRLLIWCHISGLHFPIIPEALAAASDRFVFTSPCSYESQEMQALPNETRDKLAVVSSGGGFDQLPFPDRQTAAKGRLRAGYVGSLNFSKLHPDYVTLLAAVDNPGFRVRMIGDEINRQHLEQQCLDLGRPGLLEFAGYSTRVENELAELDLLVYLLNPMHYGTTEIALLEAMAMGVVPIVMNNSCERMIVEHGVTGWIVNDGQELAAAVAWLGEHAEERLAMGRQAAATVRATYTYPRMEDEFDHIYQGIMAEGEKRRIDFGAIFGRTPSDWFRRFLRSPDWFDDHGAVHLPAGPMRYAMLERSKGSAFHFASCAAQSRLLSAWTAALARQG